MSEPKYVPDHEFEKLVVNYMNDAIAAGVPNDLRDAAIWHLGESENIWPVSIRVEGEGTAA